MRCRGAGRTARSRNDGDGARDGQDDDLQKLHGDEHDAHPDARPLQKSAEFLFIADDLDKARLDDDIEDDGGKQQKDLGKETSLCEHYFSAKSADDADQEQDENYKAPAVQDEPFEPLFCRDRRQEREQNAEDLERDPRHKE